MYVDQEKPLREDETIERFTPYGEPHFCTFLFGPHPVILQRKLEARFNVPMNVVYLEHTDGACLFIQRLDSYKLMRFYEEELTDNARDYFERLVQRFMHRMETEQFDNFT